MHGTRRLRGAGSKLRGGFFFFLSPLFVDRSPYHESPNKKAALKQSAFAAALAAPAPPVPSRASPRDRSTTSCHALGSLEVAFECFEYAFECFEDEIGPSKVRSTGSGMATSAKRITVFTAFTDAANSAKLFVFRKSVSLVWAISLRNVVNGKYLPVS